MSKNMLEPEGPQMTSQHGAYAFACLSKVTCSHACAHPLALSPLAPLHTHRVTCNTAFPRQHRFADAPNCYVIRTLSVLFNIKSYMSGNITRFFWLIRTSWYLPIRSLSSNVLYSGTLGTVSTHTCVMWIVNICGQLTEVGPPFCVLLRAVGFSL